MLRQQQEQKSTAAEQGTHVCAKKNPVAHALHDATDHALLQRTVMGNPYCCWASHDLTARL
jgi:hypothetical protein